MYFIKPDGDAAPRGPSDLEFLEVTHAVDGRVDFVGLIILKPATSYSPAEVRAKYSASDSTICTSVAHAYEIVVSANREARANE